MKINSKKKQPNNRINVDRKYAVSLCSTLYLRQVMQALDANRMNKDEMYRQVGEALHLGQALELHIHILISLLNDNFGSDIDQNGLIVKEDKKTLGRLIHELKKYTSLDDAGSEALKDALEKRNYIAHEFFNKNLNAFSNTEEYEKTMIRLIADKKTIAIATAITQGFMMGFCEALKIDVNDIHIKQGI